MNDQQPNRYAAMDLDTLEKEVARIRSYHKREPRRFGRVGTWDEPLERLEAALAARKASG